jgi:hypothetical protein
MSRKNIPSPKGTSKRMTAIRYRHPRINGNPINAPIWIPRIKCGAGSAGVYPDGNLGRNDTWFCNWKSRGRYKVLFLLAPTSPSSHHPITASPHHYRSPSPISPCRRAYLWNSDFPSPRTTSSKGTASMWSAIL